MLKITSERSSLDAGWKELHTKFALIPKVLENGSFVWLKTYQELYYFRRWKQDSYPYNNKQERFLLRRGTRIAGSVEEFKALDLKELKKTLDSLE